MTTGNCYFRKNAGKLGVYLCEHPNRKERNVLCNKPGKCPHIEPSRGCTIGHTLMMMNIKSAMLEGKVIACGFILDCVSPDKTRPECDVKRCKSWGMAFRKPFDGGDARRENKQ